LVARAVSINGDGQADKVSAADENGGLTVTRPKREEARPEKNTSAVK
jgi:HSP20 family molecular chaperone IbpA